LSKCEKQHLKDYEKFSKENQEALKELLNPKIQNENRSNSNVSNDEKDQIKTSTNTQDDKIFNNLIDVNK